MNTAAGASLELASSSLSPPQALRGLIRAYQRQSDVSLSKTLPLAGRKMRLAFAYRAESLSGIDYGRIVSGLVGSHYFEISIAERGTIAVQAKDADGDVGHRSVALGGDAQGRWRR